MENKNNTKSYRFKSLEKWEAAQKNLGITKNEIIDVQTRQIDNTVCVELKLSGGQKIAYPQRSVQRKKEELSEQCNIPPDEMSINNRAKTLSFYTRLQAQDSIALIQRLNQLQIKQENICGIIGNEASVSGVTAIINVTINIDKELKQDMIDCRIYFEQLGIIFN